MAISGDAFDKKYFSGYVGNKMKIEREKKGITFESLSEIINFSHSYIINVFNGRAIGNTEFFKKVGLALGMTEIEIDNLILEAKEAELEEFKKQLKEKKGFIIGPTTNKDASNEELLNELQKIKKMLEEK